MKKLFGFILAFTFIFLLVWLVGGNSAEFEVGDYADYHYQALTTAQKQTYTAIKKEIFSFPERIRIPLISADDMALVFEALCNDDERIFMMNSCKIITSAGKCYFVADYIAEREEYSSMLDEVEAVFAEISKNAPQGEYEKELYYHDYLVNNCTYSSTGAISEGNIYGALCLGRAKCSGYAKAFKFLLGKAKIDSVLVAGTATDFEGNSQSHLWNAVKIGGEWSYVDPTWDDPVGGEGASRIFFNMSEKMLKRTHSDFSFAYPCTNESNYFYIKSNAYYYDYNNSTFDSVVNLIVESFNGGGDSAEFMLADGGCLELFKKQLIDGGKMYAVLESAAYRLNGKIASDRFSYKTNPNTNTFTIIFSKD